MREWRLGTNSLCAASPEIFQNVSFPAFGSQLMQDL